MNALSLHCCRKRDRGPAGFEGSRLCLIVEGTRSESRSFSDNDNNITAFPTPDHAEAAVGVGAQPFTSQKQLAELASAWPAERLVEIWNSLPGVEPVKGFQSVKAAARRIWGRIQTLGENPEPKAPTKAPAAKPARRVAPSKPKSTKKATPAKKAPKAKGSAKAPKATKPKAMGVRQGS